MTDRVTIRAVELDTQARLDEIVAVTAVFRLAGFETAVNARYERRSAAVAWIISVTLGVPVAGFLTTLSTQIGKDAYSALKDWVHDLWLARTRPDGSIILKDPDDTRVILPTRIPERALDALTSLDWSKQRGHRLVWDDRRDEWRDLTSHDHGVNDLRHDRAR